MCVCVCARARVRVRVRAFVCMRVCVCMLVCVYFTGLHTGFFPRGVKFSKTIFHAHAQYTAHEGLGTRLLIKHTFLLSTCTCILIILVTLRFKGGKELKLGVQDSPPPLLYATLIYRSVSMRAIALFLGLLFPKIWRRPVGEVMYTIGPSSCVW